MENATVHFLPSGKTVQARKGDNLLQLAVEAGIHINAACGGEGACGKCQVIIESGEAECTQRGKISEADYKKGYRQACKTTILGDIRVVIPEQSVLDMQAVPKTRAHLQAARHVSPEFEQHFEKIIGRPPVKKLSVKLAPPTLSDNASDLSRLARALKLEHQVEGATIDFPALKKLPHVLREADWRVTVTLLHENTPCIINIEAGDTTAKQYAVAFDVGTTSLWGQLVDIAAGKVLAEASSYNPQIPFGDDVITRIVFSQKKDGLEKLRQKVVDGLNVLLEELLQKSNVNKSDIIYITAAGNTVMTHLLLGLDPKYIRETPYIPVANFYPTASAAEYGFDTEGPSAMHFFPCVASYVGGDIVAGVLSSGMYTGKKLTLYIDIGTNGEIVLGNEDWLMAASCSAGPAFEGGGLKCGMRAMPGAIEGFSIHDTTGEPMIVTMGRAMAKGICGSGAINILAEFLRTGIIDRNGKFNRGFDTKRIREGAEGVEYVLVFGKETGELSDIVITEADIDNLIRAKAAMFAGYHALLEKAGLSFQDLEQIVIAGAFGDFIDLEKAIAIGLLPDIERERYAFIGNGSLLGARLVCLSRGLLQDADLIARKITNIELSEDRPFMDKYIAGLFLPHTDITLFPTVGNWLNQ